MVDIPDSSKQVYYQTQSYGLTRGESGRSGFEV
jgi:hypothetical protein